MERTILRPPEVARYLGVTTEALKAWRYRGTGPDYFTLGSRHVVYDSREVEAWVDSQRRAGAGGDAA